MPIDKRERHKWIIDNDGNKKCSKCGSIIRASIKKNWGKNKYIESGEPVNFYPRCNKER